MPSFHTLQVLAMDQTMPGQVLGVDQGLANQVISVDQSLLQNQALVPVQLAVNDNAATLETQTLPTQIAVSSIYMLKKWFCIFPSFEKLFKSYHLSFLIFFCSPNPCLKYIFVPL